MEGINRSQVSRLSGEIDERVTASWRWQSRAIDVNVDFHICLDPTYWKVCRDHPIGSVAMIIAVGVKTDGRRKVLGMTVGHSEAEPFRIEFLLSLARSDQRGSKLLIVDAHESLKAAITKVLSTTWPRCRVPSPGNARRPYRSGLVGMRPVMRNALDHAGKTCAVSYQSALARRLPRTTRRQPASSVVMSPAGFVPRVPRLATLMDDAEMDVLAPMRSPAPHRATLHSTSPIEHLNGEVKRRSELGGSSRTLKL